MGDDKPFECTVPGCGMKFTNEDHLTVHKTKHQLTLTLVSDDFKSGLIGFVADQTPTPSKFLKNCEEVGLFHDLAKNPFEEAFKKAAEQPSPCNDLESSSPPFETLNTPNPGFLVAVVDNKNTEHNLSSLSSSQRQQQQNSFTHSSDHSFYLLSASSCSVTGALNQNLEWPQMESARLNQRLHQVSNNQNVANNFVNNVENLIYVANGSLQQGVVDLNNTTGEPGCMTYLLANDTLVPITLPSITNDNEGSSNSSATFTNPDSNSSNVAVGNRVVQKASQEPNNRQLIKICPSPTMASVPATSSSKSFCQTFSTKNGIARTTKERLKATIQNNVQLQANHNNMKVMSDAVDFVTQQQQLQQRKQKASPVSSTPTSAWNPQNVVGDEDSKEIEDCDDVVGSLLTGKKICLVPIEDDKRKRFLERNRAAAARCRQKKKVWMNTLAIKSEQLESTNRNMQNELKQLRKEVQLLRSLLETHNECPVTLKQRALKEEMQSDHVTSSSNSTGGGIGVVIATSDEEVAMTALSSMATFAG